MEFFRPLYDEYLDLTSQYLESAIQYIEMIPHSQFRLRGSCMLPVIIGKRTVSLLRGRNVLDRKDRIKIDRSEIKEVVKQVVTPGGPVEPVPAPRFKCFVDNSSTWGCRS